MKVAEKPSLEELKHFGVKGMRWGVRKRDDTGFRDFNVSTEKARKREAKAQKFEKKSSDLQKRIDAGNTQIAILEQNKTLFNRVKISQLKQDQRILEDAKSSADKHAQAKREGRLTPTQKKLLIGGAVVGGLIVAGVAARQLNSGELRANIIRGREILTGKEFKFKEAPELKGNWSADQIKALVVPDINEGYPGAIGSGMNCRRCTFAYELRRRGLDVAATRTPTGEGQTVFGLFNALDKKSEDLTLKKGMKLLDTAVDAPDSSPIHRILSMANSAGSANKFEAPDAHTIFARLAQEPERSRGELGVFWAAGGGHSMAYEIIGGKPHIFDCQTGEVYKEAADILTSLPDMADAGFTRLDNIDLDTKFLRRWVKNVK